MEVNDIIVLDNNERYTLLKKVEYENEVYFLSMPIDENEIIDENKILFLKSSYEDGDNFVEMVVDEDLIIRLTKIIYEN